MKLIELKTGPEVKHLLISKLQAVLDGQPPNTIPVDPSLEEIATQQDQIGWEQILRGRFGWTWNAHNRTPLGQSTTSKGHWTTEVITFIWAQWWKLWELRNNNRHGHDLATRQQAQERQLDHEIQTFYEAYAHKVPQHLAWLFDTTIAIHRSRPAAATRQWLNTWKPIIENAMTEDNPDGDPNNPENYPYTTALETG